jgi:hypothetical protein
MKHARHKRKLQENEAKPPPLNPGQVPLLLQKICYQKARQRSKVQSRKMLDTWQLSPLFFQTIF